MDATIRPFIRQISEPHMAIFKATAASRAGTWLHEALADPELFFALRDERVDIYHLGQVIYSVELRDEKVTPRTHVKYLVMDGRDPYVRMKNGAFDYKDAHLQGSYQATASLEKIKRAASKFSGPESKGIYKVIDRDALVIDVEIAFNRSNEIAEHDTPATRRTQDRVDMVRLSPSEDGFDLVFWEAKHYSSKELFRDDIFNQLAAYAKQLQSREAQLISAFQNVCRFHRDLDQLRKSLGFAGASDSHIDMLEGLASGRHQLRIVKEPSLFVFGFDNDQKNGRWKVRKKQIEEVIGSERLRAVGNPADGLPSGANKKGAV
ncbi:hypothetical protein ACCT15_34355 [Rhizobium ruizarguesonis]|uniref:hypothetical protein n=1 Tax=Rhizobium leguminosarum TaxID=384 RepID=UPI0015F7FD3B|nr:hypothetical protein [Rhizobium leguminosarum]MBA8835218.1 hypothetical protein [Rhizobium leguminosarum]